MKRLIAVVLAAAVCGPVAARAYDPAPDQATIRILGERIDGDVNAGRLPADRATLLRAEIDATQKFVTNGDSQATAMLVDIDRELARYDNVVDANEANLDLLYHVGDTITIAMGDGKAWTVEKVQNTDIMDVKARGVTPRSGEQGAYLAKQSGYTGITVRDPASGARVNFRFTIVDNVTR